MATLTCPACAAEVKPDDLICFTCGANLPRVRSRDDDPPASVTVMQEYLREDSKGPISPAVLRLTFPTGNVEVPPGIGVRLADGDIVRLAGDVGAEVSLPRQEPDPATLSRQDRQDPQ